MSQMWFFLFKKGNKMTVRKLIKKYTNLIKQDYETIIISQVISDLRQITAEEDLRRAKREGKI